MAPKTTRKAVKKKLAGKAASRPAATGGAVRLRKLIDNLAAMEPSDVNPCQEALRRVKRCLSAQDIAKLETDLALLEDAVSACPKDCGCKRGLKHAVIFSDGRVLGELSSEDGKFSGLFLNGAGEGLLGEEAAKMRYVGISGAPGFDAPVQVRDPEFLTAFVGWCGVRGCETLVLAEPYLPIWSKLQSSRLDEALALQLMKKLQTIPPDDAWRLVDGLTPPSGMEIC